jgi:hypothetical protein
MSTIGRASLATRLVAERLPGPHVRPSVDITCRCPLHVATEAAPLGSTVPAVALVPSSWVLTTSTACSTCRLASLLHLAADHGVHRVSAPRRCMPAAPVRASPPVHMPSRAFSFQAAVRTSPCAVAPSPFTAVLGWWCDLEALLRWEVRATHAPLPTCLPLVALLGFPCSRSHHRRSDGAFRRRLRHAGRTLRLCRPVRGPMPAVFDVAAVLRILTASCAPRRPKATRPLRRHDQGGLPEVDRPFQRPGGTALTAMPGGAVDRGAVRPPLP